MDAGLAILIGELAAAVLIVGGLVLRKRFLIGSLYEFDVTLMTPGVNYHKRIKGDSLEFSFEDGGTEYQVKSDRLYRVKVGRLTGLWFRLRGIKKRFKIGFQDKKTEAIQVPDQVKVSSRLMKEVNESRALDKAMRGEFKVPLDLKKILLIMGFIVVVIIAYVLVTGEVVI